MLAHLCRQLLIYRKGRIIMSEACKFDRRRFMGTAAMTVAAAHLRMLSSSESGKVNPTINSPNTSFERLKQIEAGLLNVGYAESGPASGRPVLLLHGWPYDIYSFVEVAPLLAAKGYRVIVPYMRGFGTTRFLSSNTARNSQPSSVAADTVALLNVLTR